MIGCFCAKRRAAFGTCSLESGSMAILFPGTDVTAVPLNHGAGMGMKVPCIYQFYGTEVYVKRLKDIIKGTYRQLDCKRIDFFMRLCFIFILRKFLAGIIMHKKLLLCGINFTAK